MKKVISLLAALSMAAAVINAPVTAADAENTVMVTYNYDGTDHQRRMEKLDRGLIAVKTDNGVFLSWRLFDSEDNIFGSARDNVSFKIYRGNTEIAQVKDVTNYTDTSAGSSYSVAPVINGAEGERCEAVSVRSENYFDISLQKPAATAFPQSLSTISDSGTYATHEYTVGDCSCGDVDGDGEYEIIVKWDCNPKDNSQSDVTGNVLLDAYKQDGTFLWRIDLGKNIRSGQHYTQFLVYDFDGDGKAEVTAKTAPGSKDAKGAYVTKAAKTVEIAQMTDAENERDYRNDSGYILDGDELFTIFKGSTGEALDTIYYPVQRGSAYIWGDTYGNRVDRFVANVAYLDGEKPYAVYWRGYYFGRENQQRCGVCGISFDGTSLHPDYCFDTYDMLNYQNKGASASFRSNGTYKGVDGYEPDNAKYVGEGNHNIVVGDIDDDGKDEVLSGALCLGVNSEDNLRPQWCTFLEHGDASHLGDYDPTHKGLEFFTVHEDGGGTNLMSGTPVALNFGMSVIDAKTGEIMFHEGAGKDTGRGVMANVGMGGYYQIWSAQNELWIANGGTSYTKGSKSGLSQNFRIYWDGDLYDNLLDGTNITDWNGSGMVSIFNASSYGCISVNGTKANPALQADLFGDWREEVVYPTSDNSTLKVFTSTYPTNYKIKTLMQDPMYRSGVATQNSAYNQPPHAGLYLSDEVFKPATDLIVTAPAKTVYKVGESLDTDGLTVTAKYSDGTQGEIFSYVISGFDSLCAGKQEVAVSYGGISKTFEVNVATGFTADDNGAITGYSGGEKSAVIPEQINGVNITAIADGALKDAPLSEVYVYSNVESFGNDAFSGGVTVYCYGGSEAHIYALENEVAYKLLERGTDYIVNTDFSESEYDGFFFTQGGSLKTVVLGNVSYNVQGRKDNRGRDAGDGQTGFSVETDGENQYLWGRIGRFSDRSRNAYMTINNIPPNTSGYDNVLSADIMIPESIYGAYAIVSDSGGQIDVISKLDLGIEYDTWYKYTLIYHNGSYYRMLSDSEGNAVSFTRLGAKASDSFVSRIDFMSNARSSDNKVYTYVGIDNLKLYFSDAEISDIEFMVCDSNDEPIPGATVEIADCELTTDASGYAKTEQPCGLYEVTVKAQGYIDKTFRLAAAKTDVIKRVDMEAVKVKAEGVNLDKNTAAVGIGGSITLTPSFIPSNTTDRSVTWISEDENIAVVKDGVVTGVAAGETNIIVIANDSAEDDKSGDACEVTVYDTSTYKQTVSSVEITQAPSSVYIPLKGENTVRLAAKAYDQRGVEMSGETITWYCDDETAIGFDADKMIVYADAKEGKRILRAACGNRSVTKETELVKLVKATDVYADEAYDETPAGIVQGVEIASQTIGDITYTAQARSGKGDGFSGFASGDGYVIGQAGQWSSSNRNAYMQFDKSPGQYVSGADYVFETELLFPNNNAESTVTVNDASNNTIDIITKDTLSLERMQWYRYQLIYSNGGYTRYIYDSDNNIISVSPLDNSRMPVSRLDFVGETNSQIYLDNTKYYSTKEAVSKITVGVRNEDGQRLSGVSVDVDSLTETTNVFGNADFELPAGIYTAKVMTATLRGFADIISAGENKAYIMTAEQGSFVLPTPTPKALSTAEPTAKPTSAPTAKPTIAPTASPKPTAAPISGAILPSAAASYYNADTRRVHIEADISSDAEYSGYVVAALYGGDGALVAVKLQPAQSYSGSFNFDGIDESGEVKLMWWNSFDAMNPAAPVQKITPRVTKNSQ